MHCCHLIKSAFQAAYLYRSISVPACWIIVIVIKAKACSCHVRRVEFPAVNAQLIAEIASTHADERPGAISIGTIEVATQLGRARLITIAWFAKSLAPVNNSMTPLCFAAALRCAT